MILKAKDLIKWAKEYDAKIQKLRDEADELEALGNQELNVKGKEVKAQRKIEMAQEKRTRADELETYIVRPKTLSWASGIGSDDQLGAIYLW